MPVIAKLSRRFYEVLGEDVADQMVEWFNQVGDAYRADWRHFYDAGFSRPGAKLDQRISQLELQIDRRFTAIDLELNRQFTEIDRRIAAFEAATIAGFRELRHGTASD